LREEGKAKIIMGDGGRKVGLHSVNNKQESNNHIITKTMNKTKKNINLITI